VKKAVIICGKNCTAVLSAAQNFLRSDFVSVDILSTAEDITFIKGLIPGVTGHYFDPRVLTAENLDNDACGARLLADKLKNITEQDYSVCVNAGTGKFEAMIAGMIKSPVMSGMITRSSSAAGSNISYFLEKALKSAIYRSGVYNDVSYINSLLYGCLETITDYEPRMADADLSNGRMILASRQDGGAMPLSRAADIARHIGAEKCSFLSSRPEDMIHEIFNGGAACVITDESLTACFAAAAGIKCLFVCKNNDGVPSGPFSENALSVYGNTNAALIALAAGAINNEEVQDRLALNCGLRVKKWHTGRTNPFCMMENEMTRDDTPRTNDENDENLIFNANDKDSLRYNIKNFYKRITGISILPGEKEKREIK
jgi:hypothetical protein